MFFAPLPVPGKTVRVRFVLQKQCSFGQSVCLVGGDPALGLWDPLNAFALKWAEESHDWILEKVSLVSCACALCDDLRASEVMTSPFLSILF
jgi:hypothetical protein